MRACCVKRAGVVLLQAGLHSGQSRLLAPYTHTVLLGCPTFRELLTDDTLGLVARCAPRLQSLRREAPASK